MKGRIYSEKFKKFLDIYIAILLGITTVLTALAAYNASIWGGNSLAYYNKAVLQINNANTSYLEYLNDYTQTELHDLQDDLLYAQWKNTPEHDPDNEYYFSRLSEGLQKDISSDSEFSEAETKEKDARDSQIDQKFQDSELEFDQALSLVEKGDRANSNGDSFTFITVVLAIVLFFGALSSVATVYNLKLAYVSAATLVFLLTVVKLATLPFP